MEACEKFKQFIWVKTHSHRATSNPADRKELRGMHRWEFYRQRGAGAGKLHFARRAGWFLQSHFPSGVTGVSQPGHLPVLINWLLIGWLDILFPGEPNCNCLSWFGSVWLKRKCLHLWPVVLFLALSMNFPQKLSDRRLQLGHREGVGWWASLAWVVFLCCGHAS